MMRSIKFVFRNFWDLWQLAFGDKEAVFKRDEAERVEAAMKRYTSKPPPFGPRKAASHDSRGREQ